MKETKKPHRLHFIAALAAALGSRGQSDTPYSELSVRGQMKSRDPFAFDRHKAHLKAIKNRRRTGRR